jgi:hypothetical protein
MEALYLISTVIVAVGAFVALDRQAKRAQAAIDILQAEHVAERRELLTRIQAPELAPTLVAEEPSDEPLYIPEGDFAAHDAYIDRRAGGEVV